MAGTLFEHDNATVSVKDNFGPQERHLLARRLVRADLLAEVREPHCLAVRGQPDLHVPGLVEPPLGVTDDTTMPPLKLDNQEAQPCQEQDVDLARMTAVIHEGQFTQAVLMPPSGTIRERRRVPLPPLVSRRDPSLSAAAI